MNENPTTTSRTRPQTYRESPPLDRERYKLAVRIERSLRTPMTVLAFVWLVLMVVDFTNGLPWILTRVSQVIWGLFVLQFVVEFLVTPRKMTYLKRNWLTTIALLVPAVRVFGVLRAARGLLVLRGARLVRFVVGMNRGMRALGGVMRRRGFGYAVLLSVLMVTAGAAGMYAFESRVPGSTMTNFWSALWWTAMVLTTMGSDYFPKTAEGRFLCFLLALYGFAVFGYVTATISSFFVGRDAGTEEGDVAGAKQIARLERDIAALHQKLDILRSSLTPRGDGAPN